MVEEITRSTSQCRRREHLRHWYEMVNPLIHLRRFFLKKKSEVHKLVNLAGTKVQMINVTDAWKNKYLPTIWLDA
jgi:hypothetical protein